MPVRRSRTCSGDRPPHRGPIGTYETLRRRRVETIAAQAAKINHTKTPGAFGQAILPYALPLFVKLVMRPEKTLGPVLRHRIDWPATAAR
jgi:hypothetical protein